MRNVGRVLARWRAVATLILLVAVPASQAAPLTPIPGTRISMDMPDEFEVADSFTGLLWRDAGTSVLAAELPSGVTQMQAGLTQDALASRGLVLIGREKLQTGIGEAELLEATQSAQGATIHKWILVGGDANTTVMITASVPEPLRDTVGPVVRDMLVRARWDATLAPAKGGAFAFDFVETPDLKIARNLGGAILMTEGGSAETGPLGPALIISRTTSSTTIGDLDAFAQRRLAETRTIANSSVREAAPLELAGMPAHELVATGTANNGEAVVVYQLVGYDGTNLVFVQGFAEPALEARYLPQFREIARSLRPRTAD